MGTFSNLRSPSFRAGLLTQNPHRISRRRAMRGFAGAAALLAGAGAVPSDSVLARASGVRLINPASRVLLPGEAGLDAFGLDFSLVGPPAVFFAAGDTPGWSDDVKGALGGFVFGYAAMLSEPWSSGGAGRAVQVCVHHGFPSTADAEIAWVSLTRALASRGRHQSGADVQTLDLVEVIVVEGESILASVTASDVDAVVLASRSGSDLVTVAIADFSGNAPSMDEAISLAHAEGEKLRYSRELERRDLRSAFASQWTPGFQLGSAAGAPFFAWPTLIDGLAVPVAGESEAEREFRRRANADVKHQSHIQGPFWEIEPAFPTHALIYSAQSNFFQSSKGTKRHHEQTGDRLRSSMPDATLIEIHIGKKEQRFAYESATSFGAVSAVTLHHIVQDADYPVSLSIHVVAAPYGADSPALDLGDVIDRLDVVIKQMRDGLAGCLVEPDSAPLIVSVRA